MGCIIIYYCKARIVRNELFRKNRKGLQNANKVYLCMRGVSTKVHRLFKRNVFKNNLNLYVITIIMLRP
jgi:hypothetical protein